MCIVILLQNFVSAVFGLYVAICESHSRLILNSLLVPETHQLVLTYIHTLLACSNAPGQYPTQEQYSQLPFSFWYILQVSLIFVCRYTLFVFFYVLFFFLEKFHLILFSVAFFSPYPFKRSSNFKNKKA